MVDFPDSIPGGALAINDVCGTAVECLQALYSRSIYNTGRIYWNGFKEATGFKWASKGNSERGAQLLYINLTNLGYRIDADMSATWQQIPSDDVMLFNQKTEEPEPDSDSDD